MKKYVTWHRILYYGTWVPEEESLEGEITGMVGITYKELGCLPERETPKELFARLFFLDDSDVSLPALFPEALDPQTL